MTEGKHPFEGLKGLHQHNYLHLETKKTRAQRPSFGFSPAVDWKRIDIFYCTICTDMIEKVTTAPWDEEKPVWW